MTTRGRIRVLVVDDSALVRTILKRELAKDPQIEVVGAASDAYEARDIILAHKPDVITLDVEMPRMSGLEFLGRLMKSYPVPVIMFSTLTERGTTAALEALEKGAVDVMHKPDHTSAALHEVMDQLVDKIKAVHGSIRRPWPQVTPKMPVKSMSDSGIDPRRWLIAIGVSTGGTVALRTVLTQLPADAPPILIVQHMPPGFTEAFAGRLNNDCPMTVVEATDNLLVRPGLAVIAHGANHLTVEKRGSQWIARSRNGPLVCRHRPSVEVLFKSVAKAAGASAVGVIMTGMGGDGAEGMRTMHDAGASTIAQDERSCVVFGMPRKAIMLGGVDSVVSLAQIPRAIAMAMTRRPAPSVG